jgi:repressor LexA
MITRKQKLIFDFICSYVQKNNLAPSLEEIASHFSEFLAYPSSAHYHVKKLYKEGVLDKKTNCPRSIVVYEDMVIKSPILKKKGLDSIRLPILGGANAGSALLFAEGNVEGYLKVSRGSLPRTNGVFALRVVGDSMNKAKIKGKNINEGDYVLIDSMCHKPKDGDYVLSVIDGCANLKKFKYTRKDGIMLVSESTNLKYKPIYISSHDNYVVNGKIFDVVKK